MFSLCIAFALAMTACSSGATDTTSPHTTAEGAVVSWIEAVDAGATEEASVSVHPETLALIYAIENDVSEGDLADYLSHGVPLDVQSSYWESFKTGFSDFADAPLSTLSVGAAEEYVSEGQTFASVPVANGTGGSSVIIVRQRPDMTWEVDLVATLGDGFTTLLLDRFEMLGDGPSADRIRIAYVEVVEPAMWAAMANGSFGDAFTRGALSLIDAIGGADIEG